MISTIKLEEVVIMKIILFLLTAFENMKFPSYSILYSGTMVCLFLLGIKGNDNRENVDNADGTEN